MEVTHFTDYNTHAVIGGGEAEQFGIENNAQFVTMLSSTLYANSFLAVSREIICNAWDAHKDKGIRDIPVEITIDDDELVIRDFGKGIPHDKMIRTYCIYGGTTKAADANQTGGFGLGSKSPFAYTDYFTVRNRHAGTEKVFAISRGNAETKGMPDARVIVDIPTTESGISVHLPIKDARDKIEFIKFIKMVIYFGEMNATLNGEALETISLSQSEERLILTRRVPPSKNGVIYVRYGNVVYPIESSREYADLYNTVVSIIEEASNSQNSYGGWDRSTAPFYLIFDAPGNSISVTPSRESLHLSERTIQTVQQLLGNFLDITRGINIATMVDDQEKVIFDYFKDKSRTEIRSLLYKDNLIRNYILRANHWDEKKNEIAFHRVYDFIMFKVAHGHYAEQTQTTQNQRVKLIDFIISTGTHDADLLLKLRKIVKTNAWKRNSRDVWEHHKHYTGLIRRMIAAGMDPVKRLFLWKPSSYAGRKIFAGDLFVESNFNLDTLIALSERVIYYGTAKMHMGNYNHNVPGFQDNKNEHGTLLYIDPRKSTDHAKNVLMLKKLGFVVIDLYSFYKPAEIVLPAKVKAEKAPKDKAVKYKGWPTVRSMIDLTTFKVNASLLNQQDKRLFERITKPKFVMKPFNNKGEHNVLFPWGRAAEDETIKLFGADGVIAVSDPQRNAIMKTGAIDGHEYMVNAVCDYMDNKSVYSERHLLNDHLSGLLYDAEDIEVLKKYVPKFRAIPTEEKPLTTEEYDYEVMFLQMFNFMRRLPKPLQDRLHASHKKAYPDYTDKTVNPYRSLFPTNIRNRNRGVQLDHLIDILEGSADIETKVWAETTLTLLFN